MIVPTAMAPAPAGKVYTLWLQHDNRMVAAGFMSETGAPVVLTGDAASATGAAVSVENADATPTTPSDNVVALFDLRQA